MQASYKFKIKGGLKMKKVVLKKVQKVKKFRVIIDVMGGVATVSQCPAEVEVEIIDHDLRDDLDIAEDLFTKIEPIV
jgi:hypothetical protein